MSLSRPLKKPYKKPDPSLLRDLMDAFDDVATLSPSSDEGVEVPANPQPPLLRPVAPSLSAIGGKPQGAESQDAYKTHGEGAEGDNNVTDAPNDQTRANADRPERHTMQQSLGDALSGNSNLSSSARVTRDYFTGNKKSSTTKSDLGQPDPLSDADLTDFSRFIDPKPDIINSGHVRFFDALVESKDLSIDHALKIYYPTQGVRRVPERYRPTIEQALNSFMDKMYALRDQEKRSAYSPFTSSGKALTYSQCIPGEPPVDGTDEAPPAGFTRRAEPPMNTPRHQPGQQTATNNTSNSPSHFISSAADTCLAKQAPVFWFNPGSECMQTFAPLEEWPAFFGANMPNNVNAVKSRSKAEERSIDTSANLITESLRAPAVYANRNRTAFVHAIGSVYCLHLYYACAGLEERFVNALTSAGASEINAAHIGTYEYIVTVLSRAISQADGGNNGFATLTSLKSVQATLTNPRYEPRVRIGQFLGEIDMLLMHRAVAKSIVSDFWSMSPQAGDTPATFFDRLHHEATLRGVSDTDLGARFHNVLSQFGHETLDDLLESSIGDCVVSAADIRRRMVNLNLARVPLHRSAPPAPTRPAPAAAAPSAVRRGAATGGAPAPAAQPVLAYGMPRQPLDLASVYPAIFPGSPIPPQGQLAGAGCVACAEDRSWITQWETYDQHPEWHGNGPDGKPKIPKGIGWMHNPAKCNCLHKRVQLAVSRDPSLGHLLNPHVGTAA